MKYEVKVPSSKSLVNRYLILKEGYPELDLKWNSRAEDVLYLYEALKSYKYKKELYIGEGGTTFRFMLSFLSTKNGEWVVKGKESLFKRPQKELFSSLRILGAEIFNVSKDSVTIKGRGWCVSEVEVSALTTTQVLTGLVLAALSSKNSLTIFIKEKGLNSDYLNLTKNFVSSIGFHVDIREKKIIIPGEQSINAEKALTRIESDWSSAAFLYVKAALFGKVKLKGLNKESAQPDSIILNILRGSGALVSDFELKKANPYKPIDLNLQKCPDLFPVLAVFSCFCQGYSKLSGAPQLTLKESDRIEKISDLIFKCGYIVKKTNGGLLVKGEGFKLLEHDPFEFDVSIDHRIFMACEILKLFGYKITIIGAESIKKSFPEYLNWSV